MNCGLKRFVVFYLILGLCVWAASLASAWSSRSTPLSDAVHQLAIERVLSSRLPPDAITVLKLQQDVVDTQQEATNSFKHSMTGMSADQCYASAKTNYMAWADIFVRTNLINAIQARKADQPMLAYTNLGNALHALKDATSPAHEPFKAWSDDESWLALARHVAKERLYPAANNPATRYHRQRLEGAVLWLYDLYEEKTNLPPRFFDPEGKVALPPMYAPSKP